MTTDNNAGKFESAQAQLDLDLRDEAVADDNDEESKAVAKHNYEVMPMGWSASNPFGQTSIAQLYASDSPSNYSQVGPAEVDKLAKVPGTIEDNDKAIEAGNEA